MNKSPEASTSKNADVSENAQDLQDILPPTIKEEEAEIARLESEGKSEAEATCDKDDHEVRIKFHCSACDMSEFVHHFGKKPDFALGIQFFEDTYVMRDPFKPPPPRWKQNPEYFIAIGADCAKCGDSICNDPECSFFYTRTFCLNCAEQELKSMPPEAQFKLRKQLQMRKTK